LGFPPFNSRYLVALAILKLRKACESRTRSPPFAGN